MLREFLHSELSTTICVPGLIAQADDIGITLEIAQAGPESPSRQVQYLQQAITGEIPAGLLFTVL